MTNRSYLVSLILMFNFINDVQAADIIVDGIMDEELWKTTSEVTTNFQVFPQTLNEQFNNFSYRVLTTEKGIFIGLQAITQKTLRLRTQENDKTFSNDHFQIMLDINNNAQESYVFAINHQGNYFDGIYNIGENIDLDWNAKWESRKKSTCDGILGIIGKL